jgi:hypothetical protein
MSHSNLVRATLTVRPDVTLALVWAAVSSFANHHGLELDVHPDDLPSTGEAPFVHPDNEIELDDDGGLILKLNCTVPGSDFVPTELDEMCSALSELLATGGTVEFIDCDTSPANDDAVGYRCIGPTALAATEARVVYGMNLARDALLGVIDQEQFDALLEQAKAFAVKGAVEESGDRYVRILGKRVRWHLGEGGPTELPESAEEHIKSLIRGGFNQGELLADSEDGETGFRGWWNIDFP